MAASDDAAVVQRLAERVVREADRLGAHRRRPARPQHRSRRRRRRPASRCRSRLLVVEARRPRAGRGRRRPGIPLRVGPEPPDARDRRATAARCVSALVNLLDNAVKYSEPGQPVEVGAVRRRRPGRDRRCATTASASRRATSSASSSASTGSTGRAAATPAAPARARDRAPRRAGARRRGHRRVARGRRLDVHARPSRSPNGGAAPSTELGDGGLMADPPLILVVDDEQSYRDALAVALRARGLPRRDRGRRRRGASSASTRRGPRSCCST